MSSSPLDLFTAGGLNHAGSTPWRTPLTERRPGVYVVSLRWEPYSAEGLPDAPLSIPLVRAWIERTGLTLHGTVPTPEELRDHLARWWLPDEAVVYVGKAASLAVRTGQYRGNDLGVDGRHKGGRWLKTLDRYERTTVHWAVTGTVAGARAAEDEMLRAFEVAGSTRSLSVEKGPLLSFANQQRDTTPSERRAGQRKRLQRPRHICGDLI